MFVYLRLYLYQFAFPLISYWNLRWDFPLHNHSSMNRIYHLPLYAFTFWYLWSDIRYLLPSFWWLLYVGQCALSPIQWFHLSSAFRKFMLTAFGRSRVCVSFRWALLFLGSQTITNQAMYFWKRWNGNVWSSLSYSSLLLLSVFIMFWLFIDNNHPVPQYFSSNGISFPLSSCQCQNGLSAGIIRFVLFVHIPFHSSISNSLQLHNFFSFHISLFKSLISFLLILWQYLFSIPRLILSISKLLSNILALPIKMWCFFSILLFSSLEME